jgi:DNA-directed RNA polymerase subunit N (RpoN/RPB10)
MLIVIKCFTCNKTLADKYEYYQREVEALKLHMRNAPAAVTGGGGKKKEAEASGSRTPASASASTGESSSASASTAAVMAAKDSIYFDTVKTGPILDKMGLTRYCCRRHMLGTVDMMDTI